MSKQFKCDYCLDQLMVNVEKTDTATGEKFNTRVDCPHCTNPIVQAEQNPQTITEDVKRDFDVSNEKSKIRD